MSLLRRKDPVTDAPSHSSGLWSRRWFRRVTYLIASGAALGGLAGWAIQRPAVDRWVIAQLDSYARRECGLGVQVERLEIHPLRGQIRLHHLALGGDLVRADLLEVDLEWASLLHTPHLRNVLLLRPELNLDRGRLAQIRLQPRPPGATTPTVRLDHLEIRDGQAHVREAAWGLPRGDCSFHVLGKGWRANQLWVDLQMPGLSLDRGKGAVQGVLELTANLTEQDLAVEHGHLGLGGNQLDFKGGYRYATGRLDLETSGRLDLAQAQRMADPAAPAAATGSLAFQASLAGPVADLAWTGTLQAKGLQIRNVPLHAGNLQAAASGSAAGIRLTQLRWASQDGRLDAHGTWSPRAGSRLQVDAQDIPMAPLAGSARTGFLQDLVGSFTGEASLPQGRGGQPWSLPGLGQLSIHGTGLFQRDGQRVGGLDLDLQHNRLEAAQVDLVLPELELHGHASGSLAVRGAGITGVAGLEGEAELATDASHVAEVLAAWDIGSRDAAGRRVPLGMAGPTRLQARVGWSPGDGLQLQGQAEIQSPRWHGAQADRLRAQVNINRDVLRVSEIELDKGEGKGFGELWLTWADQPPDLDQMDMCYRADRLPVREGLRAADLGDLALDGTGSGWIRLHGPFDRILLEGQCVAEQAEVYGLHIPAASASFFMDLEGNRLETTDVRVADQLAHLNPGPDPQAPPNGPLALLGSMTMDTQRGTWQVAMAGNLDSVVLGLPGPQVQALVDAHLDGPFTAPLGPLQMPTGSLAFSQGRLIQGDQTLSGLVGSARFQAGNLQVRLGLDGKPQELLQLDAVQNGPDHLLGALEIDLGPDSADTALLAPRLTQNLLKDANFRFHAQGDWDPRGLRWQGSMEPFTGQFEGFQLVETEPGRFSGDTTGIDLTLSLEGKATQAAQGPAASTMELHGRFPFSPTGALALNLAGGSNLAYVKNILDRIIKPGQYSLLAELRPTGDAVFDLNLGGTFQDTTLDGTLTLRGGRMVAHSYPLSVDNLDFTAQFKGRDILIPQTAPLRGTLAQGALSAWGSMTWRLGGISAYDLHSSLEDFQLRDLPDGFELQGSLDANLKGSDQDGGALTGSIWAKRTLYHTDINLTDLILANALGGPSLAALDPSDPLARIDLDLEVHLAEPWELDTNLLKLRGRPLGPFWIRGNLAQPGLKGRMELLPGGRVTNLFPAGDIVLERGTVVFSDPAVFNPTIDVQGQIDIPPYLVTLNVVGPLDGLQARPFSTPSLRQDEIFAILIDPTAVTTVGGAPGSSSQTAISTGLAGAGTGLLTSLALAKFQEQLRKTLNLDRVSVALRTGIGAPETSITLGKSLNLFGYRTPLVFTHDKDGEVTTIKGQVEWRFGNFVFSLGASQSTADSLAPSGEIRHSWSPR